jgi:hypothetical protein
MRRLRLLGCSLACLLVACGGEQQGYYGPCDEPAGRVLGCEDEPVEPDSFDAWDACHKLVTCGVIFADDDPDAPDQPTPLDACVDQIEDAFDAQGDLVLACIEQASCPDLARTDPDSIDGAADPNPGQREIEGVIGFCGRLDP